MFKSYFSLDYNFIFNQLNGFFARWGLNKEDDPFMAPAPEILDIEISTICHGINNKPCQFCYKGNTGQGVNMSIETYRWIFQKINTKVLTQAAFGIGDISSNPDLEKILQHTRANGIVPNITINGARMTPYYYDMLANLCGAVSVSFYGDNSVCYNACHELLKRGVQTNIHVLVSNETVDWCWEVLSDFKKDKRLKGLNAVVFLHLKKKGRGSQFDKMKEKDYNKLMNYAYKNNVKIGADTCGASYVAQYFKDKPNFEDVKKSIESCCSGRFSGYINVKGVFFPCSFSEGEQEWVEGFDLLDESIKDIRDIWKNKKMDIWRDRLRKACDENGCVKCPIHEV